MIYGDSLEYMIQMDDACIDFVLADPPYDKRFLINASIRQARRVSKGASLYFMYAENVFDLTEKPDQIIFWVKPPSTKNTVKRYSRFVEVIACYDLDRGPFNQDTHWSTRSGIFNDSFSTKQIHPFEKPKSLIEKLLCLHTNPGDLVFDPFAGSGTVERVAKQLGRKCLSIEIDPAWASSTQ